MAKVAFIGLGVMGYPMAGHLAAKGHEVTVFNRTPAKAESWVAQHGGKRAGTPAKAVEGAEFVFSCVGDDPDLRDVTLGADGAFRAMKKGAVHIDHTTASAKIARELAEQAAQGGFHFLDAPVSGGQSGAENGVLTVMVGGDPAPFERAQPVIASFARAVTLIGPSGSGQLAKMVNQICGVAIMEGLSEGIAFGLKSGLDMKRVLECLSKGAATSWQMENRGATMVDDKFDFGFAVDWMRKDLRIAMEQAREVGARLPTIEMIDGFYVDIQKMGGGRWDTTSLIRRLR
jgi:3-hydroxyisobutyrate dehydrogenase